MCLCRGAVHTRQVAEPEIRVKPQLAKLYRGRTEDRGAGNLDALVVVERVQNPDHGSVPTEHTDMKWPAMR